MKSALAAIFVLLLSSPAWAACTYVVGYGADCSLPKANPNGSLDAATIIQPSVKLYDQQGNFRGDMNRNPYSSTSTANPYSPYGNRYSSESVENPYARGNLVTPIPGLGGGAMDQVWPSSK